MTPKLTTASGLVNQITVKDESVILTAYAGGGRRALLDDIEAVLRT